MQQISVETAVRRVLVHEVPEGIVVASPQEMVHLVDERIIALGTPFRSRETPGVIRIPDEHRYFAVLTLTPSRHPEGGGWG